MQKKIVKIHQTFSPSSLMPARMRTRGNEMWLKHHIQASRLKKNEKEETRRKLILQRMFQKKEKGEKRKYLPEEKRKYLRNSAKIDLVPGALDLIIMCTNGRFRFLFSAKFRMMKFPTCFMKPININHRASSNYFKIKPGRKCT